jgi:hypothetical protein
LELEVFSPARALADDARAEDVRWHEVRGELNPFVVEPHAGREALAQERLSEPWDSLEQHVAACEDRGEDLIDDRVMADDDLVDFGF